MNGLLDHFIEITFSENAVVIAADPFGRLLEYFRKLQNAINPFFIQEKLYLLRDFSGDELITPQETLEARPVFTDIQLLEVMFFDFLPHAIQTGEIDAVCGGNERDGFDIIHSQIKEGEIVAVQIFHTVAEYSQHENQVADIHAHHTGYAVLVLLQEADESVQTFQIAGGNQIIRLLFGFIQHGDVVIKFGQQFQQFFVQWRHILRSIGGGLLQFLVVRHQLFPETLQFYF